MAMSDSASSRDEWLARLVMGCLWPYPEGRFGPEQFIKMLESRNAGSETWPNASHWESLQAKNSVGFPFCGKLYFRASNLAEELTKGGELG